MLLSENTNSYISKMTHHGTSTLIIQVFISGIVIAFEI